MSQENFSVSFLVDKSPEVVFNAINNVRGWWSGEITGETNTLGAEFEYRYKDFHYSKQKITELVPGQKIVWHVTDAKLSKFAEHPGEWVGTNIIFEISQKDGKTQLTFTHQGLVPAFECYNACTNAWSGLIGKNLREVIEK
jgi:Activator of Hsp90 ATPase homolog 1-like protein